jgi:oxygen-independent coproporphyrinogen-3 oxidase
MKHGLYFHIPFCEQRCHYCAFTVAVAPESSYGPYIDRLVSEWELADLPADAPGTVYWGGGTPSLVSAESIGRIIKLLGAPSSEISIEVNPGTLSPEKVAAYRQIGVNRVSLGAQSLEDEDLDRAGRLHRAKDVFHDYRMLQDHGFGNINLDLIAGLPGQRADVWRSNLDRALQLRPQHFSIYILDQEDRSVWGKNPADIPDEDGFAAMYQHAEAQLEDSGYIHYEISNWALPGYECRHNLGYWNGLPYRGFGVGAHSYADGRRFWNTDSLADYARHLDRRQLPIAGSETLTREMRVEEAFMLGLRRTEGLDVLRLAEDLGIKYPAAWFRRIDELQDAGWLDFDGRLLKLTSAGRLAATAVTGELLWPTPSSTLEAIL